MKQISSEYLFFSKKVFPAFWFGLLLVVLVRLVFFPTEPLPTTLFGVIFVCGMAGFGYAFMKHSIFNLADEVLDNGNSLTIRFRDDVETLPLSRIKYIYYRGLSNPSRATLVVEGSSKFGNEISFWPKRSSLKLIPLKNDVVEDLRVRIEQARG